MIADPAIAEDITLIVLMQSLEQLTGGRETFGPVGSSSAVAARRVPRFLRPADPKLISVAVLPFLSLSPSISSSRSSGSSGWPMQMERPGIGARSKTSEAGRRDKTISRRDPLYRSRTRSTSKAASVTSDRRSGRRRRRRRKRRASLYN